MRKSFLTFRDSYGVKNSDGTWSGIIGDLVNGEIDIAVAALTQVSGNAPIFENYELKRLNKVLTIKSQRLHNMDMPPFS